MRPPRPYLANRSIEPIPVCKETESAGNVLIYIEEYNISKKRIDGAERLNEFVNLLGILCKTRFACLKELHTAFVSAECREAYAIFSGATPTALLFTKTNFVSW